MKGLTNYVAPFHYLLCCYGVFFIFLHKKRLPSTFLKTGTRIIYDRKFLLECRNSPIAKTPPCCLPQIPGVTVPATHPIGKLQDLKEEMEEEEKDISGT